MGCVAADCLPVSRPAWRGSPPRSTSARSAEGAGHALCTTTVPVPSGVCRAKRRLSTPISGGRATRPRPVGRVAASADGRLTAFSGRPSPCGVLCRGVGRPTCDGPVWYVGRSWRQTGRGRSATAVRPRLCEKRGRRVGRRPFCITASHGRLCRAVRRRPRPGMSAGGPCRCGLVSVSPLFPFSGRKENVSMFKVAARHSLLETAWDVL